MTEHCVVCDCRETVSCYQGIVRCQQCGHVYADMRLSAEELAALYQHEYFFGDEYQDYIADKAVLQKNFALRMRALQPYLQPSRHQHLFEIGSAYGFFLDTVRNNFATVRGIDITEDGPRYAQEHLQLDVVRGDFLDYPCEGQSFDVVCLWDTIEHLQEPQRYIEKLSAHTKPGALLTITTGDIASLNARWKKETWRLLHPPTHLHYFSPQTLSLLLERYGFSVIYNRYCGFYRSMENMMYNILVLRKHQLRLYEWLKKVGLTRGNLYLNLYDIMYVIAQRR